MEKFVDFMSGKQGRLLRIVIGAAMVLVALYMEAGAGHYVLLVLGALFIVSGVAKVCGLNLLVGRRITDRPD